MWIFTVVLSILAAGCSATSILEHDWLAQTTAFGFPATLLGIAGPLIIIIVSAILIAVIYRNNPDKLHSAAELCYVLGYICTLSVLAALLLEAYRSGNTSIKPMLAAQALGISLATTIIGLIAMTALKSAAGGSGSPDIGLSIGTGTDQGQKLTAATIGATRALETFATKAQVALNIVSGLDKAWQDITQGVNSATKSLQNLNTVEIKEDQLERIKKLPSIFAALHDQAELAKSSLDGIDTAANSAAGKLLNLPTSLERTAEAQKVLERATEELHQVLDDFVELMSKRIDNLR